MPPKAKPTSKVYVVINVDEVDSVHATLAAAEDHVTLLKSEGDIGDDDVNVQTHTLVGGSITVAKEKVTPKARAKPAKKVEPEEQEEDGDEKDAPPAKPAKANTAAKKKKSAAETRAEKAAKAESELPENIKSLLAGEGDVFGGKTIVVTGIPPKYGRANVEKLVTNYGGKVSKSVSKSIDYVVVGDKAGPKKLEQIEELGVQTLNEDELIELLENGSGDEFGEGGSGGAKRSADEEEDEEGGEEEEEAEKPMKKRAKKA